MRPQGRQFRQSIRFGRRRIAGANRIASAIASGSLLRNQLDRVGSAALQDWRARSRRLPTSHGCQESVPAERETRSSKKGFEPMRTHRHARVQQQPWRAAPGAARFVDPADAKDSCTEPLAKPSSPFAVRARPWSHRPSQFHKARGTEAAIASHSGRVTKPGRRSRCSIELERA
jgi:hypothetical protein